MSSAGKKSRRSPAKKRASSVTKTSKDAILGITNSAIKRIVLKSGCERVRGEIYGELRDLLQIRLGRIVEDAVLIAMSYRRKTIKIRDVAVAIENRGHHLATGHGPHDEGSKKYKTHTKVRSDDACSSPNFKPGTVARREISKLQQSQGFLIRVTPFRRLIKAHMFKHSDMVDRMSADAYDAIQLYCENYLVELCKYAYLITCMARHGVSICSDDLAIVLAIRGEKKIVVEC